MPINPKIVRFADYPVNAVEVTVAVTLALAPNPERAQLAIQNRSGGDIHYKIGITEPADADEMFLLADGKMVLMASEGVCTGSVWLLAPGTVDVHVGEGV